MDVMRDRETRSSRCGTLAVRCSALAADWPFSQRCGRCVSSRRQVAASCASASSAPGVFVGRVAGLWVKAAPPGLFSSRHPEELKDLVAGLGPLAQNGTVSQAVAFGDALFFAVPYGALPQVGRDYGGALEGKIVLDACNAVPARDGAIADEVEREGIGITSQKYLPGTHLVRAFNTLAYTIFVREANRPDPKLAIPTAGDDGEALAIAAGLVRDAGFEPVVVGKLVDARRFQRGAPGYGQSVTAAELSSGRSYR